MLAYNIKNIVKRYSANLEPASNHISLEINAGEIFGILGDNGAGKSTLVKQMVNLIDSDSGTITLFDKPIATNPLFVTQNVGYMPQDGLTLHQLTVSEALFFTAHLRGMPRVLAHQECKRLVKLWDLSIVQNKMIQHLSGGQRRLVQIAVAMAAAPPVLILDEPTSNLDPQRRQLVWQILRQYNSEQKSTIILITHDALEAEKVVHRIAIMHQGRILIHGRPSHLKSLLDQSLHLELFFDPTHPPELPTDLQYTVIEAGRWIVHVSREQASTILSQLDLSQLYDFHLYSSTLEDLYFYYAK